MIRIFYTDIQPLYDDEIFNIFYENISEERQTKINSFRFRKDKNLSLAASCLIDFGLRKYGLLEKDMTYGTCENRKPCFRNAPEIHFNISHSENMAAVAFSDSEVGIDIEKIKEADIKIAKRFFAEDEYRYLERFDDKEKQTREFYRLWTLKESYLKFTGLGMKLPLNSFCINTEGSRITVNQGDCYFYEYNHIDGFCLAVCSDKEIIKPEIGSIGFLKG